VIGAKELATLPDEIASGRLRARVILDRAWDWGGEYARHCDAVKRSGVQLVNDYDLVRRAWYKPTMHYQCIAHGLSAPYMLVLPPYESQPTLQVVDTTVLGTRFSVKGAHSGGSGVLPSLRAWEDVLRLRTEWPGDETLLQAWVEPRLLGQRRAWFRIFYACGSTFLCWADDQTHDQTPVAPDEETRWRLEPLRGMAQQIAGLCQLNLFSTEIALDQQHVWQVIDYVNEPCDYRLKSKAANGVPDEVVAGICERLAGWVQRYVKA
jgi:hypothetical protein